MAPRKTKNGTWEIRWRDATGKPHTKRYKRHEDAKRDEILFKGQVQAGTFVAPSKLTVAQWADQWLEGAHNLRDSSRRIYQTALAHITPELGHYRLDRATAEVIDTYLAGRLEAVSPATVHIEYRTLRRLFKVAVARQKLARSPMADVVEPRVPGDEMQFLTADQLEAVATAVDQRGARASTAARWRTLVLVAGWGGLRWGELAGLRAGRVDTGRGRVQVVTQLDPAGKVWSEPKTRTSRRWVTLPPGVALELAAHVEDLDPDDLVWTLPAGGPLQHSRWMQRVWYPAVARAGLGTYEITKGEYSPGRRKKRTTARYEGPRFHDLRHTSAALAVAAGAHPKALQMRMGHSSIQVTLDRYGHLFPEVDDSLAATLDTMRQAVKPRLAVVR